MENKSILIVDDDAMTLEVLSAAVKGMGYKTFVSKDGDDAKYKIIDHKPDLVISDIFMPAFSGLQLLNFIQKKSNHNVPVILISSMNEGEMDKMVGDAGAFAFLSKPLDFSKLKTLILEALKK